MLSKAMQRAVDILITNAPDRHGDCVVLDEDTLWGLLEHVSTVTANRVVNTESICSWHHQDRRFYVPLSLQKDIIHVTTTTPPSATQTPTGSSGTGKSPIYSDLPRVVEVIERQDCGTGATCPHCGAQGRYIIFFRVEGSTEVLGAMAGCFSRFPKSKYFETLQAILKKEADYKKKGWDLASWDRAIRDAIRCWQDGELNTDALDEIVEKENRRKRRYRKNDVR